MARAADRVGHELASAIAGAGQDRPSTGLVLAGGGARGAYQAGAIRGLVEVLGCEGDGPGPFDLMAGTSVGAINATYLASHAHRADLGTDDLGSLWEGLRIGTHLRPSLRALWRRALIDPAPIERLVHDHVDWTRLRANLAAGILDGLFVAALEVASGKTSVFADLAPSHRFHPSRDPARQAVRGPIGADHVMSSAAIPGVFPPHFIGQQLFYDGGLRFNTPLSPVIRSGAERIVVVSPLFAESAAPTEVVPDAETGLSTLFLAGKMLNAVMLDPFAHDVQVLERFNDLLAVLERTLTLEEKAAVDAAMVASRGVPYRSIDVLVLSPSEDIGQLGLDHLEAHRWSLLREGPVGWLLALAAGRLLRSQSDLVSHLLFDGAFAATLMDLGRRDTVARAEEIRAFFDLV